MEQWFVLPRNIALADVSCGCAACACACTYFRLLSTTGTRTCPFACAQPLQAQAAVGQVQTQQHSSTLVQGLREAWAEHKATAMAEGGPGSGLPQIVYSSRTHSQLQQVMGDLKKSSYRWVGGWEGGWVAGWLGGTVRGCMACGHVFWCGCLGVGGWVGQAEECLGCAGVEGDAAHGGPL